MTGFHLKENRRLMLLWLALCIVLAWCGRDGAR